MNSQKSALALLAAAAISVGLSFPVAAQEDKKPQADTQAEKAPKEKDVKNAKAEKDDGSTVILREKPGTGVGREGNWKKHAQGAPTLKAARKKVEDSPKSADAHNDLGWALRQNGKLEEAEKELRTALQLDDTIAYGHSNLSVVLLDMSRVGDAVKEGERAVAIDGNSPIYRVVYGNALSADGKLDEAIKEYSEAIKLRADYENALYNLGRVLHLKGKNAEATSVLSQALKLDPNDRRVMDLMDKLVR
jgi:tetratricopeptide (TPR) repeat protein